MSRPLPGTRLSGWRDRWRRLPARARRAWLGLAGIALILALLVILREPLGRWLWPDPRYEALRQRGEQALQDGQLERARALFEAALALQPDQLAAREGLDRVAQAALARARNRLDAGDVKAAEAALQLARALQAPTLALNPLQARLQAMQQSESLRTLLARAAQALAAGHLDDGPEAALPLYAQVLERDPRSQHALEGREDALTELLRPAPAALARGDLAEVAALIRRAERFDPGFTALPALHAQFSRAVERRLEQARTQLARGRLAVAARHCAGLRAALPAPLPEPCTHALEQALLHASRQAIAQGHRQMAEHWLALAAEAGVAEDRLQPLRQALATQRPPTPAPLSPAARARLHRLLRDAAQAQARGHWLTPPGRSAWDLLQQARALAPAAPEVHAAAQRLQTQAKTCHADALRDNDLGRARVCLDLWQQLAPTDPALVSARRRLAARWLEIGDERLRGGDVAGARQALERARQADADVPGIDALAQRLQRLPQALK